MVLGNSFIGLVVSFIAVFPVPRLSSQSAILKAGRAAAGLNSCTGTTFGLSIVGGFGGTVFPVIPSPGEGITTRATADIHGALIPWLSSFAASQAGCFI